MISTTVVSAVCTPVADMPRIDAGPYKTVSLVLTIVFPLLLIVQYALFLHHRKYYVFLRKRSLPNVSLIFVAAMMSWGYTVLYDYIGAENYPCWLFHFLIYASTPIMACMILLQTSMYLSEINLLQVRRRLKEAGDQESLDRLKIIDSQPQLTFSTSRRALAAHLRLVMRLRTPRDRQFQERILNMQFARSKYFNIFWLSVTCIPFAVAYFARLGTDPQWTQCSGCEMSTFDAAFIMAMIALGAVSGGAAFSYRVSKVDALRILREAKLSWTTAYLSIIIYSLYLADPGGLYASHVFNWRMIFLLEVLLLCYIKTTHQVIMARLLERNLLTSNFLAREDRFDDVQKNRELRILFRMHLDSELSSEIYQFMEEVDELRTSWDREKEGRQARARHVFDTYIQRRSHREVNLSHPVREQLLADFTKGNVDVGCFDGAYTEIKVHLMNDGFARFLSKLSQDMLKQEKLRNGMSSRKSDMSGGRQKRLTDLIAVASSASMSTEGPV